MREFPKIFLRASKGSGISKFEKMRKIEGGVFQENIGDFDISEWKQTVNDIYIYNIFVKITSRDKHPVPTEINNFLTIFDDGWSFFFVKHWS